MNKSTITHALTIHNTRERYEYVYDAICEYLDNKFKENNYCDFVDDKCVVNRGPTSKNRSMGCCYSFNLDMFLNVRDKKLCQYLVNKQCATKCISCKLYTCKYLAKKGISFSALSFPDIRKIFNRNQLEVLRYNCFKTREQIIDKLLVVKKIKMPYFLFYLFYKAKIKD